MQERKINLEEVIAKNAGYIGNDYYVSQVKKAMFEFGKQLLELAAENAKTIETSIEDWKEIDYELDFNYIPLMNEWEEIEGLNKIIIDKQSILNTINQIE